MGNVGKRALDVAASVIGLVSLTPLISLALIVIWLEDKGNPFYVAPRVGLGGKSFHMLKLRTMVVGADKTGWDSTKADDPRLTRVGTWLRALKLDELPQLWNVLKGEMSLVGPRPNVAREISLYTDFEKRLLEVKPGITDLSSIVFSDLATIIAGYADPNQAYRVLVRPGKSRLGVFYVDHRSFLGDVEIILLTILGMFSRESSLRGVGRYLSRHGAENDLIELAITKEQGLSHPDPKSFPHLLEDS
ncbi:MAG TPA: sugar transferase [Gemmatimonadetes bacterium]|nr:sugar transferase [Gemmatimonadota bacterium]HAT38327.1 sugar transferase [Gemmatimonadota bacterium]HBV06834.1 sugar transferase [Gemmatimonadota bacterium]|tara:strand:+ start:3584 stop:4324 length:741 start_codon:yes stop_codon:yes gene_type:complete